MSDDDYSELSELEASDWEDGRRKSKAKEQYRITNALKAPRATSYTAQALVDQIVSGDIDLEPEYQRDVVWPEVKQVGLIDSVFRNFYIPPIIFSVNAHEDGSESRVCIDGKQRLTSIYRFMLGLTGTGEKYWYKDSPNSEKGRGKKRQILPEKYRRIFANKQIVCVEYSDINDKDEREIFQRVQLGMALTPAEKLGVVKTPRADFVREIQSKFFKDEGKGLGSNTTLDWDRSRGTDFRCLAIVFWCIDRYLTSPASFTNTGSIPQLEAFLSNPSAISTPFRKTVLQTFQVMEEIILDESVNGVFKIIHGTGNAKVSPIEFICSALLIAVWKEKMDRAALARAIGDMRREVRAEHVDIRLNTKVGKTMISFVKGIKVEGYAAAREKDEDVVMAQAGVKRKRDNGDDEAGESKTFRGTRVEDNGTTTTGHNGVAPSQPLPTPAPTVPPPPRKNRLAPIRALKAQQMQQYSTSQENGQSMLPSPG